MTNDKLGRTVKGSAADVVNGLSKNIRPELNSLSKAVDEWEQGGGSTAVAMLQGAASRFQSCCDLLGAAQRVYAHLPGKEDEEE